MNWTIYALECIAATVLFTGVIMIPLCRNPVWWIHDYPKDIQEVYFQTHERIPAAPLSVPALVKKSFDILLSVAVLTALTILAGANDFKSIIGMALGLIPCLLCGAIVAVL